MLRVDGLWMDLTPVPAGTQAGEALTLRGPNPDLVYAIADSFHATLSQALHARPSY